MMLEATNQGLGTCWIGGYDESVVKKTLGVPDEVRVVSMLSLGYPGETPKPRPRKELKEILFYETYE
jgi:nitroreductase